MNNLNPERNVSSQGLSALMSSYDNDRLDKWYVYHVITSSYVDMSCLK